MNNSKNEFEDKEIIQENINNENYCNDIQICNITMNIDYIIYVAFKKKIHISLTKLYWQ